VFPAAAAHDGDAGPGQGRRQDVHGIWGHSKADAMVNVYMQAVEESVKQTQDAIDRELMAKPEVASGM